MEELDKVEKSELIAVIKVLRQAVMEVRAAQDRGPGWYTKGAKGLYMQVRLWLDKSSSALKSIQPVLDEMDRDYTPFFDSKPQK